MRTCALTFSRGIARIPYLDRLLGVDAIIRQRRLPLPATPPDNVRCVLGWGCKPNTVHARRYAASRNLSYLALEDGFLRSVGLGVNGDPPLSIVVDDLGIYYDAAAPSRLETLLNSEVDDALEDGALLARARQCIKAIVDNDLSKYNASPDIDLPVSAGSRVLVVDQTAGDRSIVGGLADGSSFERMLQAALAEHPDAEVLVKIHPDVVAGRKTGHLAQAGNQSRVRILDEDINPLSLMRQVGHVYVVTSLTGFEALMLGKPVTCFGAPFYAGWGLTDDRVAIQRRRRSRSLEQVFAAAYILYSRYRDPDTGASCEIETVIEHLALQRRMFRENAGELYCYGFAPWKRGYVRRYLYSPWNRVRFIHSTHRLKHLQTARGAHLVVWGMSDTHKLRSLASRLGLPVWRMEDGFFRSVGLGSDLTAPASLALDKLGIYFDPAQSSNLEVLIQKCYFGAEELTRARKLREAVVTSGLSKYNVGHSESLAHSALPGQRVILVPGQVEDDASVRYGSPDILTNAGLLRAVREGEPDAYIIYKPHPDVLSGNRNGIADGICKTDYDQIVTDAAIVQCLATVDEVHTMTSLVGFEGLLRGKRVVTYGMPFYAGWGLTEDRHTFPRRSRRVTLDELVAACLIRYTRYLNITTGRFTTPEYVVLRLRQEHAYATVRSRISQTFFTRTGRKIVNLFAGLFYAR